MSKHVKRLALIATFGLLTGWAVPSTTEGGNHWLVDDCGICSQFGPGPNGTHKFDDDTGDERTCLSFPEEQEYCHPGSREGGCFSNHYDCTPLEVPLAVEAALQGADARALATLQRVHGGVVRINFERKAVQVFGCSGRVVAHYPLPDAVVADLQ